MHNYLLILFVLLSYISNSQSIKPEFEFKLYITNKSGDSDSITLGYDKKADALIDSQFDEHDISSIPINSNLDIRYSFDITNQFHLKRSINIYNCDEDNPLLPPIGYPSGQFVGFYSSSFPVILKWNKDLFKSDTCRKLSFITRVNWYTFDYYKPSQLFTPEVYLGDSDSLILDEEHLLKTNYEYFARKNFYNITLINGNPGTFYMFYLGLTGKPLTILLDNKDPVNPVKYSIFPNPVSKDIALEFTQSCEIKVFNLEGKLIDCISYKIPNFKLTYDMSSLVSGYYLLKCKFANTNTVFYPFIKL